jgi:hypothetical protein
MKEVYMQYDKDQEELEYYWKSDEPIEDYMARLFKESNKNYSLTDIYSKPRLILIQKHINDLIRGYLCVSNPRENFSIYDTLRDDIRRFEEIEKIITKDFVNNSKKNISFEEFMKIGKGNTALDDLKKEQEDLLNKLIDRVPKLISFIRKEKAEKKATEFKEKLKQIQKNLQNIPSNNKSAHQMEGLEIVLLRKEVIKEYGLEDIGFMESDNVFIFMKTAYHIFIR